MCPQGLFRATTISEPACLKLRVRRSLTFEALQRGINLIQLSAAQFIDPVTALLNIFALPDQRRLQLRRKSRRQRRLQSLSLLATTSAILIFSKVRMVLDIRLHGLCDGLSGRHDGVEDG